MFYPQKIKNAVTYSVTTFCEKLYALCLVVPPVLKQVALIFFYFLTKIIWLLISNFLSDHW